MTFTRYEARQATPWCGPQKRQDTSRLVSIFRSIPCMRKHHDFPNRRVRAPDVFDRRLGYLPEFAILAVPKTVVESRRLPELVISLHWY